MREFWRIVGGLEGEGGLVCSYFHGVGGEKVDGGGSKAKPGLILLVFRK